MSSAEQTKPHSKRLPAGWIVVRVAEAGAVRLGRQRSPDQASGEFPTPYVRGRKHNPDRPFLDDLLEMNFTPAEREVLGSAGQQSQRLLISRAVMGRLSLLHGIELDHHHALL